MKLIKLNKEQSKIIIEELTNPPELTDEKRAFLEECVRISKKVGRIAMREIKFSLYVPGNGGMRKYVVTGIKYKRYGEREISEVYIGDSSIDGEYLKTGEVHLVQYTGLKDCNGKEIYEGDILKVEHPVSSAMSGTFAVEINCETMNYNVGIYSLGAGAYKFGEVIGNMYENPELIKDEFR